MFQGKTWVNWLENKNINKPIKGNNVKLIKLMRITQGKWAAWSNTPFGVHLPKIYIHLRQRLKLDDSASMNFINANEVSVTLFACVLTFNNSR